MKMMMSFVTLDFFSPPPQRVSRHVHTARLVVINHAHIYVFILLYIILRTLPMEGGRVFFLFFIFFSGPAA